MNKKNNIVVLVFIIPIIFSYVFELIILANITKRFSNVIEHIFFAIILISIAFLIKRISFRRVYLKSVFILFCFMLFFETIYYYYFKSSFNASATFIVLETNGAETSEFLTSYFDTVSVFLICVYSVFIFIGIRVLNKCSVRMKTIKPLFSLALIGVSLMILKVSKLVEHNLVYSIVKGSSIYVDEMIKFDAYNQDNKHFTDVKRHIETNDNELYIIIIGESVSRLHVQLYEQYDRATTPLLYEIKNELMIMNDVISPHTYTIASLTKGLTLANAENPERKFDGSIIHLLNQADYKTYWISNQRPIGLSDTQVTKIASAAQETIFLNTKHTSEKTPYDEVLLDELEKVVNEEMKKKVVFIHMIGAHKNYEKRVPPSFKFFEKTPQTKFKSKHNYKIINAYDNAIRYTDSVVRNVIEIVRKQNAMSYVLYLSDHGQEVYDDIEFHGQTNDELVTKNMYEIPFFLWTSSVYQNNSVIADNTRKRYVTDDLIHSIADLSKISAKEIDSTRSIFSPAFIERKRFIKDTIDYDIYFSVDN